MSSEVFHFKQFDVRHDRSSMRVGTDGVLLGAWAGSAQLLSLTTHPLVLDIGTGCGLITLMLAQRFPAMHITGIDIDLDSIEQARENVTDSPFADRIEIIHQQLETFTPPTLFSLIVSNPPFYEEDTVGYRESRNNARHTSSLTFEQLITDVDRLLCADGVFDVIIPYSAAERFIGIAAIHNLSLSRRCNIKGGETRPFKRSMLSFTRHPVQTCYTSLTLNDSQGHRSPDYQKLTDDFYLK